MSDNSKSIPTTMEEREYSVTSNDFLCKEIENRNITGDESRKEYRYVSLISNSGGEGIVAKYVDDSGKYYAIKVCNGLQQIDMKRRKEIVEFTRIPEARDYLVPIEDTGSILFASGELAYYEVQPFCEGGDLVNKKLTFSEMEDFIQKINEALHFIHSRDFIHMDIKPENIYISGQKYLLGDFGIVKKMDEQGMYVTRVTHFGKMLAGTELYMAPEVKNPLVGKHYFVTKKADYYSLAITIASLYLGHFVFDDDPDDTVKAEEANSFVRDSSAYISHLPLGGELDDNGVYIQNLVDGLYQLDPNRRFGYDEVKTWLGNHRFKIDQRADSNAWASPFTFEGKKLYTPREMLMAFSSSKEGWNEAKLRLYNHTIENHFGKNNDSDMQTKANSIVERDFPMMDTQGDAGLLSFCVSLYHENDLPIIWKGASWKKLSELADEMLNSDNICRYEEIFVNEVISTWMRAIGTDEQDNTYKIIRDMELKSKHGACDIVCWWYAFLFSLDADNRKDDMSYSIVKFASFLVEKGEKNYSKEGLVCFFSEPAKYVPFLGMCCWGGTEGKGCSDIVFAFADELSKCGTDAMRLHAIYAFLECLVEKINPQGDILSIIRRSYVEHGPLSDLYYTYTLVQIGVYVAMNDKGDRILDDIKRISFPLDSSISELRNFIRKEQEKVDNIRTNLQNNPYLSMYGIMQNKDIRCLNSNGFFLYEYNGRIVPYGYQEYMGLK